MLDDRELPAAREERIGRARLRTAVTTVRDDPVFMRRLNGWLTIVWIVMIPISLVLGLLSSVAYVSALSLWALVSGHWAGWQAARVEVAQELEAKKREEEHIEEKVVEKLLEETSLEPADDALHADEQPNRIEPPGSSPIYRGGGGLPQANETC